jgi:hypothetical protein
MTGPAQRAELDELASKINEADEVDTARAFRQRPEIFVSFAAEADTITILAVQQMLAQEGVGLADRSILGGGPERLFMRFRRGGR